MMVFIHVGQFRTSILSNVEPISRKSLNISELFLLVSFTGSSFLVFSFSRKVQSPQMILETQGAGNKTLRCSNQGWDISAT